VNAFNRAFVSLFSLVWVSGLAACLLLVWDASRVVDGEAGGVRYLFDIDLTTQAEQILATIVIGGLILLGLTLLAIELVPRPQPVAVKRDESTFRDLQTRVESLQRRVDERPAAVVRDREVKETVERREPVGVTRETVDRREHREDAPRGRRRWHFLNR